MKLTLRRSIAVAAMIAALGVETPFSIGRFALVSASAQSADDIDDVIEDDIEEDVEDDIEGDIEDDIESDVEDDIESDIEDDIESDVEDDIESDIEDDIESDIEDDIESDIEDDIESDIEDDIESDIEDDIESDIEDDIESDVEDDIEDDVEDDVEDGIEDDIEGDIEGQEFDDFYDDRDDDEYDDSDDDEDDYDDDEDEDEDEDDDDDDDDDDGRSSSGASELAYFELGLDDDDQEIIANERLVLIDPESLDALRASEIDIIEATALDALDLVVARVASPPGADIATQTAAILAVAPEAEIDFNHLYRLQAPASQKPRTGPPDGFLPSAFMRADGADMPTIGQIDTRIDEAHPALRDQQVRQRDFIGKRMTAGAGRPAAHGTAVASILVGRDAEYSGVAPTTPLLAASVFQDHPSAGVAASADSLVRAIDWMIDDNAGVVNMSLSGPPNLILERAIERMRTNGVIIVAAVGNKGPRAAPQYPAAYEGVIGVTAVGRRNRVYRMAGRGEHVDFAAPGVDIVVAAPGGGYDLASGTSMAAPFAAAAAAAACARRRSCADPQTLVAIMRERSLDLGKAGRDPTYGHGLLQP